MAGPRKLLGFQVGTKGGDRGTAVASTRSGTALFVTGFTNGDLGGTGATIPIASTAGTYGWPFVAKFD